jgi:hypothetical protein
MVDKKSKDGNSTVRLETPTNAYDMVNENFIRIVNEMKVSAAIFSVNI